MDNDTGEALQLEVEAIGVLLKSLQPLSGPSRERVLEYVTKALDIQTSTLPPRTTARLLTPADPEPGGSGVSEKPARPVSDIRSLKDSKQPRSAIEMAALVAYYVSELAPDEERRESIETADVEKYFKQAQYPLPGRISNTLPNAAAAGYFDSAGRGQYRLNPVGHNLVVHNLPAGSGPPAPRKAPAKKSSARKPAAKKAPTKTAAAKKARSTVKKTGAKKTSKSSPTSR